MSMSITEKRVKDVLEISGFDSLLDLYEDEEQAVRFFQ